MTASKVEAISEKSHEQGTATRKRKRIVISCTECHRRKQKCDRLLPCSNCIARTKQSHCHYDHDSQSAASKRFSKDGSIIATSEGSDSVTSRDGLSTEHIKVKTDSLSRLSAIGYARSNGYNTLSIFNKIDGQDDDDDDDDDSALLDDLEARSNDHTGQREKFKGLIRQLPTRPLMDQLVADFFKHVNFIYCSVDEDLFMEYLQRWKGLHFSVINRGPQELPKELRFFPALIFQILALALQFQPPDYDPALDSLKYVSEMSLDDLASDYSESGNSILAILGKRDTTLVAVQASFLRTSFLKNSGLVIESWHSLGQTIRDAQEIGLHKDRVDHESSDSGEALEAIWQLEFRRRMWASLQMWDSHMALVLGRPSSLDPHDTTFIIPVDTPLTKDRRKSAPLPRSENDIPTPLTALLWNCYISLPLRDILSLEKEGAIPKDYSRIEQIHEDITQRNESLPPYLRARNPDTTYDSNPDCQWLPASRSMINNGCSFNFLALHRPYIFTIQKSRVEALKASLNVLCAHRQFFHAMSTRHHKMFNLVYSSFDALVVVAAIFITYPTQNHEYLETALQQLQWGKERFEVLSKCNETAKAALTVVRVIQIRLMKALSRHCGIKAQAAALGTPSSLMAGKLTNSTVASDIDTGQSLISEEPTQITQSQKVDSLMDSNYGNGDVLGLISRSGNMTSNEPNMSNRSTASVHSNLEWSEYESTPQMNFIPEDFDFGAMQPLQPMHDLLYNDLNGIFTPSLVPLTTPPYDPNVPLGFNGEFPGDSFWDLLNQYNQ